VKQAAIVAAACLLVVAAVMAFAVLIAPIR
jgi:hypothetical protein